jgi:hypothetical protein
MLAASDARRLHRLEPPLQVVAVAAEDDDHLAGRVSRTPQPSASTDIVISGERMASP